MSEFVKYIMYIKYEGLTIEYIAVRNCAGMFDVSNVGEVEITEPKAFLYV